MNTPLHYASVGGCSGAVAYLGDTTLFFPVESNDIHVITDQRHLSTAGPISGGMAAYFEADIEQRLLLYAWRPWQQKRRT